MELPYIQTAIRELSQIQTKWRSILNPMLSSPELSGLILKDVALASGNNVIDHLLARKMQGWTLVDLNASASIYRSAPFNDKTLTLNSNAVCTVSIKVF